MAHGATVINMSIAGSEPSQALQARLQSAGNAGVLITVAAGNQGADLDAAPEYPAAYAIPHLIAVAATDDPAGQPLRQCYGHLVPSPAVAATFVLLKAARPSPTPDQLQAAVLGSARRTGLPVTYGSPDIATAARRVVGTLRARKVRRG